MCAGGSGRVVSPRPSSSFHPREAASLRKSPLPPLVLQADHVGEVLPLVVAEARRAEPPPLLYAALRGCCAPSLASSSLSPYVEERPTDEHGSAEQDESGNDGHRDGCAGKPRDEAQALACNIIRVHGGLRTLSWSEGHLPRRPIAGAGVAAPAASDFPIMRRETVRALAGGVQ